MKPRSGVPTPKKAKTAGWGATICMECGTPLARINGAAVCRQPECKLADWDAPDATAPYISQERG